MAKKQFFRHRFLAILVLFENPDKKNPLIINAIHHFATIVSMLHKAGRLRPLHRLLLHRAAARTYCR